MELLPLQSPPVPRPPSSSRKGSVGRPTFFSVQPSSLKLFFPSEFKESPHARNSRSFVLRPRAAGKVQAVIGSNMEATKGNSEDASLHNDLVFVAGATGRVGSRAVRELLKLGLQVRAGVRSAERAEPLVKGIQQMKVDDVDIQQRLEIVECNLENQGEIVPAVGNASTVICCIGASEKEVLDISGPYRIDYNATRNLIDAATTLKVDHFILLTSIGTNKIGFPAAILNLFWGVLLWKRKAEEALIASGLPYTIVRPGGMERPTDAYKETHNVILANEDTYFGGQVSNLQVAELIACMAKNRSLSFCKVVEVIAETTAPLTPMEKLLSEIPSQRVDTSPLKPMPERDPTPVGTSSESTSMTVDNAVIPRQTRPLSPYTAYDDLKPPTSPTPTPSTTSDSGSTITI